MDKHIYSRTYLTHVVQQEQLRHRILQAPQQTQAHTSHVGADKSSFRIRVAHACAGHACGVYTTARAVWNRLSRCCSENDGKKRTCACTHPINRCSQEDAPCIKRTEHTLRREHR